MPSGIARICNVAIARKARFHVLSSVKQTTSCLAVLRLHPVSLFMFCLSRVRFSELLCAMESAR